MEADKTLPSWLNNETQENPSVSRYWPRRPSPVVHHKALFQASLEKLQNQTHQVHRRQSMEAGWGGTPDSTGLRLISV